MEIKFTSADLKQLSGNLSSKRIILYGDFNVINLLYEKRIKLCSHSEIYPDSSAVHFTLKYLCRRKTEKIVSTDLQDHILAEAVRLRKKVFFFGDTDAVLSGLIANIFIRYPRIIITGVYPGYNINNEEFLNLLQKAEPDILFVGLGAGRQESWISDYGDRLNIPLIISTGGWFRYLAGLKSRAPLWMRKISLEWLYKLITDFPRVWQRYLIGIPKFIFRIISGKIILVLPQ